MYYIETSVAVVVSVIATLIHNYMAFGCGWRWLVRWRGSGRAEITLMYKMEQDKEQTTPLFP